MKRLSATVATTLLALAAPPTASARVVELGATQQRPVASCPENCQAVVRVTGFQVSQGAAKNPFLVRSPGKIVAFSIQLGKPRPDQIDYFNDQFGGPPQAQISILRPGSRRRHRLTGQSELFDLEPYFGSTPTFALDRPLTVRKGYVVALTVPRWAPAFGVDLASDEAWRSSRQAGRCDDVTQEAAQRRRTSLRTYGCLYRTARLLYTATFIPDPRPTNRAPKRDRPASTRPPARPPAERTPEGRRQPRP